MSYALDPLTAPVAPPPEDQAPVLFQSSLKLTEEQEKELTERCLARITEVSQEMGLNTEGTVQSNSFMGKRGRNLATYDNDNEWRKLEHGGVFVKSNLSFGMSKRMVRETTAKVCDDLLGTRPFFGALKTPMGDASKVRAIEELIQQKVDHSDIQLELRAACRTALIANETVLKIRYVLRATPYLGKATVLVDETGNPLKTPNGLMVYEDDDFVEDKDTEGLMRLKKDPLFSMVPEQYQYKEFESLPQTLLQYEGVEVRELDYRSFICPLRVGSIHEADFCAQLFDDTAEHLQSIYGKYQTFDSWSSWCVDNETSGERQPRSNDGERQDEQRSRYLKMRSMAECYLRCDIDGDGSEEEIFAVMDRGSSRIIFYDYLANVMPKRPFEVIPGVEKVPNRWYGEGVIQMMMDAETYVDAQYNRFNIKDGRESSITFRHRGAVREWKNGEQVEFGGDTVYDVEEGFDKENRPPIWRVNLTEKSEIGMELMKEAQQQANLQFGVISAKDASATNLNNSRTATGILNIERTSNLLIKGTEIEQQAAIIRVMGQVVTLILENIKDTELLLSKDGNSLLTINKEEARSIERDVRLLLTRSRSSEMLSTNQQALVIAKDFHLLRHTDAQQASDLRPLYLNQLKSLEVADADDLCPAITEEDLIKWVKMQEMKQTAELKRTSREMVAYKDCPPTIQAQWEQEMGFQPATPEERLQHLLIMHPPKLDQPIGMQAAQQGPPPEPKIQQPQGAPVT